MREKKDISRKVESKEPPKPIKRGPRRGQEYNQKGQVVCPANENDRVATQMRGYSFKN